MGIPGVSMPRTRLVEVGSGRDYRHPLYRCQCGVEKEIDRYNVIHGRTKSCGCLNDESRGAHLRTHGMSGTKLHRTWKQILTRCYNPNSNVYEYYGGRGIGMCGLWRKSFASFAKDVGEPPSDKHEIDRYPDRNGNYEPGNVRWATRTEQVRNSNRVRRIVLDGREQILGDWAAELGICTATLIYRIKRWGVKRALTTKKLHG